MCSASLARGGNAGECARHTSSKGRAQMSEIPDERSPSTLTPRTMPVWMSVPIILMCVAGGVYFTIWYLHQSPSRSLEVLGDLPGVGPPARRRAPVNAITRETTGGVTIWRVRADNALMDVRQTKDRPPVQHLRYQNLNFVPGEQVALRLAYIRITTDKAVAQYLSVSDEQLAKLKAVAIQWPMQASKADREKLGTLFQQYQAKGASAERPLIAELAAVGQRSVKPTRDFIDHQCQQIRGILTPEQIKRFEGMGKPPAPPAK
jgi:hypothetical protein